MEENQFQAEKQHLAQTIDFIHRELARADAQGEAQKEAIRAVQEEHLESSRWESAGLHSIQGFAEMLEQSQEAQNLARMESARDNTLRMIRTLVRMRERPYFARIDFRFQDGKESAVYIGRATLMDKATMKMQVYDWRVPIASVFYRYGVGPAQYEAPAGTIRGELLLKRQYEIRQGELLYYFDANEEVLDSFLRDMLGRPASSSMRDIVETIQRDQDRVIRDMEAPLLMVQGSAGSGKTSVALHRVAYLMYQGLQKARLDPSRILILAPNATFERYISQVLPGLGEEQVRTLLPEELLAAVLPARALGAGIQPRSAWVERRLTARGEEKRRLALCRSFKGSQGFVTLLERFLHELPRRWIPFADVDYAGQRVARAELCRTEICQDRGRKAPLGARLAMLEKAIWERVHALRPARMEKLLEFGRRLPHHAQEAAAFARMISIRESGRLLQQLRAFTRVDCVALYRQLFEDREAFVRLSGGLLPAQDAEALRQATAEGLVGDKIPYEDAAAMAYLQLRVYGCRTFAHLRQVVADEAQDLDVLHARLMALLFPGARFTLLGDVYQTLGGSAEEGLYERLAQALDKGPGLMVRLDKSFRCTREIWEFSRHFLPPGAAGECFSRSGAKPRIHGAADEAALADVTLRLIQEIREKGFQSIAVVCKTDEDAKKLYQQLKGREAVALVGPGSSLLVPGVSILSLYRAKGLEFDAVLLWGVDAARYPQAEDRGLLYVGCTRALHILELLWAGEPSPLLPKEESL